MDGGGRGGGAHEERERLPNGGPRREGRGDLLLGHVDLLDCGPDGGWVGLIIITLLVFIIIIIISDIISCSGGQRQSG